jgi:hypothetical protein
VSEPPASHEIPASPRPCWRLSRRSGPRPLLIIGSAVFLIGGALLAGMLHAKTSIWLLVAVSGLACVGPSRSCPGCCPVVPGCSERLFEGPCHAAGPFEVVALEDHAELPPRAGRKPVPGTTRSRAGSAVPDHADANAARCDEDHNATLHTIYRSFGDVRPTTEVLQLIHAT